LMLRVIVVLLAALAAFVGTGSADPRAQPTTNLPGLAFGLPPSPVSRIKMEVFPDFRRRGYGVFS
jgi:hypothetical protein